MIVIDNGHDIVIWLIIEYHIMQKCNTDNHNIWTFHNVFYYTCFFFNTLQWNTKPYSKTIVPYDISYNQI